MWMNLNSIAEKKQEKARLAPFARRIFTLMLERINNNKSEVFFDALNLLF